VNSIYMDDKVKEYIVDLVLATRPPTAASLNLNGLHPDRRLTARHDQPGLSAARATAFLNGRHYVTPRTSRRLHSTCCAIVLTVSYEGRSRKCQLRGHHHKILDTAAGPVAALRRSAGILSHEHDTKTILSVCGNLRSVRDAS